MKASAVVSAPDYGAEIRIEFGRLGKSIEALTDIVKHEFEETRFERELAKRDAQRQRDNRRLDSDRERREAGD